eukprot:1159225-Pelagomonas_calceolata.AAC.3
MHKHAGFARTWRSSRGKNWHKGHVGVGAQGETKSAGQGLFHLQFGWYGSDKHHRTPAFYAAGSSGGT